MNIRECMNAIGGNYDEIMARLMSEDRVRKFLLMFLKDDSFENLCVAMKEKDYEVAFRCAHTLKGTCLNLGIGTLGASAQEITEALRGNVNNGADILLPKVADDYYITIEAIRQLQDS